MLNLNRSSTQIHNRLRPALLLKGIFIVFPHSKRVPFSFSILFNFQGPALPCGVAYLLYQIRFPLSSPFLIFFSLPSPFCSPRLRPLFFSGCSLAFRSLSSALRFPAKSPCSPAPARFLPDSFVILPHPHPPCQLLFSFFLFFSQILPEPPSKRRFPPPLSFLFRGFTARLPAKPPLMNAPPRRPIRRLWALKFMLS